MSYLASEFSLGSEWYLWGSFFYSYSSYSRHRLIQSNRHRGRCRSFHFLYPRRIVIPPTDSFHVPASLMSEGASCCSLLRILHRFRCCRQFQPCLPERDQPPALSYPLPRSCQPHRGPLPQMVASHRVSSSLAGFQVACVRWLFLPLSIHRSSSHLQIEIGDDNDSNEED